MAAYLLTPLLKPLLYQWYPRLHRSVNYVCRVLRKHGYTQSILGSMTEWGKLSEKLNQI